MSGDGGGLFGAVLRRGATYDATADGAWLQAMLDVEAALAEAQADVGLASAEGAGVVRAACRADRFDADALGAAAVAAGNPVVAMVRALTDAVGRLDAGAASLVHRGATSQDVIDSAAMLVSRRALELIEADVARAAERCAQLASVHRALPMAGRTLGQQAAPITFGFKAAGWLAGLVAAGRALQRVRVEVLAAQLGGAVGTLSVFGDQGPAVLAAFSRRLGLAEPVLAWHTERSRIAELAGMAGTVAGVVAKIAGDVVLLSQSEVAEVRDTTPGRGGSSAMPHKRNPVAAIAARAAAMAAPGAVATLLGAMAHEHERAAGAWHAEWLALIDLLRAVGSAVAWLVDTLEHLDVDPAAMAANLARTDGLLAAELVAAALAPSLGRSAAQALLEAASATAVATGRHLRDVVAERPEVTAVLSGTELAELFDPRAALGSTDAFIERALADAARWSAASTAR